MANLVDELARLGAGRPLRMEPGQVIAVSAGAAKDGNALVTVAWRGASVNVPYPSSYSPAVGHVVLLLIQPPQVVLIARLIGTP